MRLVEVPAIQRDLRPVDGMPSMRPRHCLLEAPNPAVALRRHADFDLESFDESLRAQPDGVRDRSNARREWDSIESGQREGDARMHARRSQRFSERDLDGIELRIRAAALEEPFAERGGETAPRATPGECRHRSFRGPARA